MICVSILTDCLWLQAIVSVLGDAEAKKAWHAVILQQQGHRDAAEKALGLGLGIGPVIEEGDEEPSDQPSALRGRLETALLQKEEEESAKRKARRQMFLLQE